MEPSFWRARWERGQIGFHQQTINRDLIEFWASLGLPQDAHVLVPLCGKTQDLLYLRGQGHRVTGVELSGLACEAFFREQGLEFKVTQDGDIRTWSATDSGPPLRLIEADILALTVADVGHVDGLYDRAATIALPPAIRARYARQLAALTSTGTQGLLITIDYPEGEKQGPPFSVPDAAVQSLYGDTFEVKRRVTRDALEESGGRERWGLSSLSQSTYALRRR